jgi:hypothetical protein
MSLEVDEIEIDAPAKAAGYVTLAYDPINPLSVAVDPLGGPAQVYGVDFEVLNVKEVHWGSAAVSATSSIKSVVDAAAADSQVLRIIYER